jgi:AraC-like DNA-binding protein
VEQFATARFDVDLGAWFRTKEGQEAAKELMASIPILRQLVARDLLKGVGEQRISNTDLAGVQATLLNINKADDFNARTLRQLRNYLKRSVTHSLEYVGSYGLPEKTLHRAAQLGIDVKSIEGRNGFYSPYLADQTYAVTRQNVPSYSREYQTQLRDESIFGYVARSGGRGQPKQYELIMVNEAGEPMWNEETEKYETTLIPHEEGWQAGVTNRAMLDFNRNFLMQTYGLDR